MQNEANLESAVDVDIDLSLSPARSQLLAASLCPSELALNVGGRQSVDVERSHY